MRMRTYIPTPKWRLVIDMHLIVILIIFLCQIYNGRVLMANVVPLCLLLVAISCNALVLFLNGGRMPVLVKHGSHRKGIIRSKVATSAVHTLMTKKTRCNFLSDRFYINTPFWRPDNLIARHFPRAYVYSIGDILYDVSFCLWVVLWCLT